MPIQILPPQLANQIAAGEVVERPASVVKELIENSLDAGATRIEVEIEKGGAKRMLIRDNGSGVEKAQLELALSRHATSKIIDFDDLENIATLGFRGEALASISSVSRLSMSSRTAEQAQAWQASAQGREMQVSLQPTAHPVGTSLEVSDLFFNTPARRKFLRTEKTEFSHIDELIKRLALSRFDVALSLKHNGKLQRQYRISRDQAQAEKRIAAVLGKAFIQHCLHLDNQHQQLRLHGWLGLPEAARSQNDQQYFYVNGRMMRDKLLQHAIRQSFAPYLGDEQYAAYVLYLELPVDEVDVNVHPAKHEVRFHQARLVHDYLVRVLSECLGQMPMPASTVGESQASLSDHAYHREPLSPPIAAPASDYRSALKPQKDAPATAYTSVYRSTSPGVNERRAEVSWLAQSREFSSSQSENALVSTEDDSPVQDFGLRALHLLAPHYLLCAKGEALQVLDCQAAQLSLLQQQALAQWPQGLDSVPLLLPLQLRVDKECLSLMEQQSSHLQRLGFHLESKNAQQLLVKQVPKLLRRADFALVLPSFLNSMQQQNPLVWEQAELVIQCLLEVCVAPPLKALSEAKALLLQLQALPSSSVQLNLWRNVDSSLLTTGFNDD